MDEKNLLAGQALFQQHCAGCHGEKGKGDGAIGLLLPVKPADLTDLPLFPAGLIEFSILTGGDTEYMPAWKKVLSQKEIEQIGNYLRSFNIKPVNKE